MNFIKLVKQLVIVSSILSMPVLISSAFANVLHEEVSEQELSEVISKLNVTLDKNYIFPEVSLEIKSVIESKLNSGEYNRFKNGKALAEQLTKDVQDISKDRHLKVYFDPASEAVLVDPSDNKIKLFWAGKNRLNPPWKVNNSK